MLKQFSAALLSVCLGFRTLPYAERLKRLKLPSLELRRLHFDLLYCYKIVFGLIHVQANDFFAMVPLSTTRGHSYKLYKKRSSVTVRCMFYSEHVVNAWNNLLNSVDFTSLTRFARTIKCIDLSGYLRCFSCFSNYSISRPISFAAVVYFTVVFAP